MKEDAPEWDSVLILGARDGPCEEGRHTPAKDLVGKKIKNSEVALFQSRADEMGKADGSDLKKKKTKRCNAELDFDAMCVFMFMYEPQPECGWLGAGLTAALWPLAPGPASAV